MTGHQDVTVITEAVAMTATEAAETIRTGAEEMMTEVTDVIDLLGETTGTGVMTTGVIEVIGATDSHVVGRQQKNLMLKWMLSRKR